MTALVTTRWAIELAADLRLKKEAVISAHEGAKADGSLSKHPLQEIITWWSGDYVAEAEKNDNE